MDKLLKVLEYDKIISLLSKYAVTSSGIQLCKDLSPTYSFDEIDYLLKETREAVSIITKLGDPSFGAIHDISVSIKRAEISSVLSAGELLNIADTLRGSRLLKKYGSEIEDDFFIMKDYFSQIYINTNIEDSIYKCIDSEDHLSDHASGKLFKIRTQIREFENTIREKINSIIRGSSYSKYLQENIVTIRNDRYVIPVKQEYRSFVPGLVHDSSATGSTLFIEPMAIVDANNKIHELYIEEKIEIEKILSELSSLIFNITDNLKNSMSVISKLDFCFAKAKFAIELNAFPPVLNDYGYINLKKARHPLIDKRKVVPIDVYLGDDFTTLVITGPNTGGKTVTLKTLGLLTLMAYSGLFIPCVEFSEIAVFEHVFADIGDEQSIEQSLSTFSAHMTNIISIINNSTSNSLILIDELGSGTDPVEGAALAISILEHLCNKGCRVVASTHYSELKTYALSTTGVRNASCEFDINTLNPTYKLVIGLPGKSNAFAISKKLGLDSDILSSAEKLITGDKVKFEEIISNLQKNRQEIEFQKEKTEKKLKETSTLKNELDVLKNKLDSEREKIINNAKEEAKEILLSAENTAKESIREIIDAKNLSNPEMNVKFDKAKNKIKLQLKKVYSPGTKETDSFVPFEFKIGDSVYIPSLEQEATVLSLPDKDNNLFIQVGIIKSKIHLHKLRPSKTDKKDNHVKVSLDIKNRSKDISPEISLLGMNVEEALYCLDNYIHEVLLSNLTSIRIIHGKGEGILKKAVHEYLRTCSSIKTFRLGTFGEGDFGVTIAELR